jgi:2-alkyl-3-oxoalkanoate reductase
MRVLVTGGTSLIGSATANQLIARGHEVTLFQRHASGSGLPETLGDIGDAANVREAVNEHDAVVHLAAKVGVAGRPEEFERINVGGTQNVLRAMADCNVGRLVFVSSPSVAHTGEALVGAEAGAADPEHVRFGQRTARSGGDSPPPGVGPGR